MGITKSSFRLLLEEAKKGNIKGKKILQLGRQHAFLTFSDAINLAKKAKFQYHPPTHIQLSFNDELKNSNYIDDTTLFHLLGFNEVHSVDVSAYEQSTFVHDLNKPVPSELHQQYDVVLDGGTLEHIFNVPQVFKNIHALLKEDGVIIHASPSHNNVDHGFYMFSPTLFSEYYTTNVYKILSSYIFEYGFEHNTSWTVYEYKPGCLDSLSFGGFGGNMLGVWFVAQKQSCSTEGIIPQQGACRDQWSEQVAPHALNGEPSPIKDWLKKSSLLRSFVIKTRKKINQFKTKHFRLKKIGTF